MPTSDGANFFIGDYAASTGVQLNPLTGGITGDTTLTASSIAFAFAEKDPAARPAGSIGDAIYYTKREGVYKSTGTVTVDSYLLV